MCGHEFMNENGICQQCSSELEHNVVELKKVVSVLREEKHVINWIELAKINSEPVIQEHKMYGG